MEKEFFNKLDYIIDMLEDDTYKSYTYKNGKFNIIDNDMNINVTMKLGNNNFYYKDNITGLSYIFTKKYIDDNTTIQQIFIEEDNDKCYYSFLERESFLEPIKIARTDGRDSFSCDNNNIINKNWSEILEYADEIFWELEEDLSEYGCDKEFKALSSNFVENEISESETYMINDERDSNQESELEEYEEILLEEYSNYNIRIKEHTVDGRAKIKVISDCSAVIEQKYAESILVNEGVQNLKMVLEAKHKEEIER